MDISGVLALKFVVFILVQGIYCDTECDCNTNKALMELIQKDYLQMRLENFKIMSRLRRLEISKQTVSTQSDPLTAKGSSQSKAGDGLDKLDANYANVKAQSERMKSMEAKITNITAQSEKVKRDIEIKLAKTAENLERIDKIEDNIIKIEEEIEVMNRNEASSTNGYKMAFDLRNFVRKSLLAEKSGRLTFASDIRNQIENIKHSFSEFKIETATLVHNQSVSLSTKHEAFTEQMTRQFAEVNRQIHTDIGDITSELKKVTEKVSKMNTEISTLNEITIEDKADGAWSGWSSWGSCSATCGGGIRSQTRTCTQPKPSLLGNYCDGSPMQLSICNKQTCPVITDCLDIFNHGGGKVDGIYTIRTWKTHQQIRVYCDMTTAAGGWTVIQHRFDKSVDFYRNFSEYENGFGDLTSEFWLGLKYIQEIASQSTTHLRIDVEAYNGKAAFETFNMFKLSPRPAYTLYLGDTISSDKISEINRFGKRANGTGFSTFDHDVDTDPNRNCASDYYGGWWYDNCFGVDLNGRIIYYHGFIHNGHLKSSKMMIRRN